MLKFTIEQLNELTDNLKLLVINFATFASWADNENHGLYNCYFENADILQVAKNKLKLSDNEVDFLYHFFLENGKLYEINVYNESMCSLPESQYKDCFIEGI